MRILCGTSGLTSSIITLASQQSQKEKRNLKGERERQPEKLFEEILADNFPDLGKKTDLQVQEAQRFQMS